MFMGGSRLEVGAEVCDDAVGLVDKDSVLRKDPDVLESMEVTSLDQVGNDGETVMNHRIDIDTIDGRASVSWSERNE